MTARKGPKNHLATDDVLEAVSVLGVRWTMAFSDEEIIAVNEALDRELVHGNLVNAFTVSPQGRALLAEADRAREMRLDVRVDTACARCRLSGDCWVVACTQCGALEVRHLGEADLQPTVRGALESHRCPSPVEEPAPDRRPASAV